jgi:hypothetical protein
MKHIENFFSQIKVEKENLLAIEINPRYSVEIKRKCSVTCFISGVYLLRVFSLGVKRCQYPGLEAG